MKTNFTMKNLLSLSLFLLSLYCTAQSNLQFSSVVFNQYNYTSSVYGSAGTLIVPDGHVLKITSASCYLANSNSPTSGLLTVNNHFLLGDTNFPVWLPAGSYSVKADNTYTATYTYSISGILFKVISI